MDWPTHRCIFEFDLPLHNVPGFASAHAEQWQEEEGDEQEDE